jgi:iron complex transport system ATP-binding protein
VTLRAESITVGYRRGRPVLRGLSLELRPGVVTAIVGPNGAGKSTLLRSLLALLNPWEGRCTLDGTDVRALPARRRASALAYIPQRSSVVGGFRAREVVRMGRHALVRDETAVEDALGAAGVADLGGEVFAALSVGQQQRVTLARALAQLAWGRGRSLDGRALLADEPVSAMDPRHALATLRLLRAVADAGAAVVIVLHDLTSALRFADDAALLASDGALVGSGPASAVLSPAGLEPVFGVPFERFSGVGGPAVEPGPASADRINA